jgi:hypothetical protein
MITDALDDVSDEDEKESEPNHNNRPEPDFEIEDLFLSHILLIYVVLLTFELTSTFQHV